MVQMTAADNLSSPSVKSIGKVLARTPISQVRADSPVDSGHSKVWVQLAGLIINILAACPSASRITSKSTSSAGYTLSLLEFITTCSFPHIWFPLHVILRPKERVFASVCP